MIKKIQFRGISRTPTYHLTEDGGCSESLNVQLDDTEVSPMLAPEEATPYGAQDGAEYLYIHKFDSHKNYIYLDGQTICYTDGVESDDITDMETDETVTSVTSVGKTLVVYGSEKTYYFIWKDGAYVFLGNRIPEPVVEFDVVARSQTVSVVPLDMSELINYLSPNGVTKEMAARFMLGFTPPDAYDQMYQAYKSGQVSTEIVSGSDIVKIGEGQESFVDICSDYAWGIIDQVYRQNKDEKYFTTPVLVRAAVKLYDGTNIYHTVPFLIGNGLNQFVNLTRGQVDNTLKITFEVMRMLATANVTWDIGDWGDIVTSVEFALSTDICNPKWNSVIKKIVATTNDTGQGCPARFYFESQNGWNSFDDVKDEVLSKVVFYKVHEITTEEFLAASGTVLWRITPMMQDELVVRQTMKDNSMPHDYSAMNGSTSYNMRSILQGVTTELTSGYPFLQSTVEQTRLGDVFYWRIKYFIRSGSGDSYTVLGRDANGDTDIYNADPNETRFPVPLGLLVYPDPNCYKVEIYDSRTNKTYSVPMKEHPGLNCAYALCDLSASVTSIGTEIASMDLTENKVFSSDNTVLMSEAYNPFLFDVLNRKTFGSKVIGIAPVTKALSTGQFGQFPLYVFTEEGIQAIGINDDGSFGTTSFVSRDVAIEGTVAPIDQAVVFSSEQGVMLLVGSDIECLSPWMNGRHEPLNADVASLLENTVWADYALEADQPFMAFIKGAKAAYDYAGKRLIFFNGNYTYQYVYLFGSKSWHKLWCGSEMGDYNILNSYPECLVSVGGKVLDFSTHLDASLEDDDDPDNDQPVLPGILETRTFGLDADDTYKVIRRIRIRGNYTKGRVKFILLASHDGRSFRVIHSFRGPSWKYFKLVILSQLRPTERISFAEIDYDVKFNDRIR